VLCVRKGEEVMPASVLSELILLDVHWQDRSH